MSAICPLLINFFEMFVFFSNGLFSHNSLFLFVMMQILGRQLESLGLASKPQMISRFLEVYKQIWSLNGDHISRIYAGTGALGGGRSKVRST